MRGLPSDHAIHSKRSPRDHARLDHARPDLEPPFGDGDVVLVRVLVDLETERGGEHHLRLAEDLVHREDDRARAGAGLVGVAPEAEAVEDHLRRRVTAHVGELLHDDLLDREAEARHRDRQQVAREAGVDAGAVQRAVAGLARGPEALDLVGSGRVGEHEAGRGHEVLARLEDAAHVVEIGVQRRVVHAIGVQREDLVDVVRRDHAHRLDAGELAGVAPDLVGRGHVAADELELRVARERLDRDLPDRAGRPLDHAIGLRHDTHWPPLTARCWPVIDAAQVGREEEHRAGALVGRGDVAERQRPAPFVDHRFLLLVGLAGHEPRVVLALHRPERDAVHEHAGRGDLVRERAHEASERRLRRRVRAHRGRAADHGARVHEDHPTSATRGHHRHDALHQLQARRRS